MQDLVLLFSFLLIVVWVFLFVKRRQTDKVSLQNFSGTKTAVSKSQLDFYNAQLKKYSTQQTFAFYLLWTAILFSICCGAFLIYKKIIVDDGEIKWLKSGIGLAGGSTICASSFALYRSTSNKIQEIMKKIKP